MIRDEARTDLLEEDDDGRIIVCRNIPGDHTGGPDCWCLPYVIDPSDEVQVQRMLDLCNHPERQTE